tara:strand:+ start:7255 stop:7653 length:399 start_codon:yes stop_codon:yes gene_type:complete
MFLKFIVKLQGYSTTLKSEQSIQFYILNDSKILNLKNKNKKIEEYMDGLTELKKTIDFLSNNGYTLTTVQKHRYRCDHSVAIFKKFISEKKDIVTSIKFPNEFDIENYTGKNKYISNINGFDFIEGMIYEKF